MHANIMLFNLAPFIHTQYSYKIQAKQCQYWQLMFNHFYLHLHFIINFTLFHFLSVCFAFNSHSFNLVNKKKKNKLKTNRNFNV